MPQPKNKKKCTTCSGNGVVKTKVEVCQKCQGKKCIQCGINQSGYDSFGYDECNTCNGIGELIKS